MKKKLIITVCAGVLAASGLWNYWRTRPTPEQAAALAAARSETEWKARLQSMLDEAQNGPAPALRVARAEMVLPTPLEAFEGADTKINVAIECDEEPPSWWGTLSSSLQAERGQLVNDGRISTRRALCILPRFPYRRAKDRETQKAIYETSYLVRLDGFRGPLTLRDELPIFHGKKPIPKAVVKIEVPILARGEAAKNAKVSREPGAVIEKVTVEKESYDGEDYPDSAKIAVSYRQLEKKGARGVKMRVFDEKGKMWPIKPQFDMSSIFDTSLSDAEGAAFTLHLDSIPRSAGRLTVRGYAYCGDKWPAPFSLLLRDAKGQIVETRASTIKFKVMNTDLAKAEDGTLLAAVFVQGQGNAKKLREVRWLTNPYPILESGEGESISLSPNDVLQGIRATDDRTDTVGLDWTLRPKVLPRDTRGWSLKTWIRADSGPKTPISIPLDQPAQ